MEEEEQQEYDDVDVDKNMEQEFYASLWLNSLKSS